MTKKVGDPRWSDLARQILEYLQHGWPTSGGITLGALGIEDADRSAELLATVGALSDRGYLMYEALVLSGGSPCFTDASITRSGSAALRRALPK